MVVFQEKDPYFLQTMKAMNVMRKDVALCDIVLTVGQQTIHAHRCVLAAASPYFNSLFLGNFSETSMGNIDLSSVTTDTEAVEMIIDFIYTGEINITKENLGVVIKLATYFLVDHLREFCIIFLNTSLDLKNCLRYFFYSQDYGLHKLYKKTLSMIESRFHDFIIFEQTSLDITPVELHFLLTNKVLQFCRVPDLLEFVLKWLLKGPTEKHFAVALDVIDNVSHDKHLASRTQRENDLEDLFEKVAAKQEGQGTDSGKTFLTNSRRIMSKMSHCSSPGPAKTYNLRQHSPQLSSKQEGHTEMALVVFAPRPCVVETVESRLAKGRWLLEPVPDTEPAFDLCVYVVSNQTWYHVQELTADQEVSGTLLNQITIGSWTFAAMKEKLICVLPLQDKIYFFDLLHMTWRLTSYNQLVDTLERDESFAMNEVISVLGADQTMYLILKIRIHVEDEDYEDEVDFNQVSQVYFRCFRLQDIGEWEAVFDTPRYSTEDYDGNTTALISTGSNELIILHSSESNNCVYLADMSEEKPEPLPLLMTSETVENLFHSVHLLEGKNQMYVVKDTPQKVSVTYEYKLKSRKLVPVSAAPVYLTTESGVSTVDEAFESFMKRYPCLNMKSVSDGTSLWRIEGNGQKTSRLTELRVARNKSLVQVRHNPPPFPCVTAVFAGRLDQDIISRLQPIARYLSP